MGGEDDCTAVDIFSIPSCLLKVSAYQRALSGAGAIIAVQAVTENTLLHVPLSTVPIVTVANESRMLQFLPDPRRCRQAAERDHLPDALFARTPDPRQPVGTRYNRR